MGREAHSGLSAKIVYMLGNGLSLHAVGDSTALAGPVVNKEASFIYNFYVPFILPLIWDLKASFLTRAFKFTFTIPLPLLAGTAHLSLLPLHECFALVSRLEHGQVLYEHQQN